MDWQRFEHAKSLKEAAKPEEAISVLRGVVGTATDPVDGAIARMTIAHCLRDLGRPEEARIQLREVYSMLDNSSDVYPRAMFIEALVEEDQGNWEKELKTLDTIVSTYSKVLQNPDHQDLRAEVLRHRGIALLGLGKYTEAKPLLQQALLEDYDKDLALNFLGQCYLELGELENAKNTFREALRLGIHPGYEMDVRYRLGVIHYRLGEYAWAMQEFEWCFEHRNNQERVSEDLIRDGLTSTLKALGKNEEAERYSRLGR